MKYLFILCISIGSALHVDAQKASAGNGRRAAQKSATQARGSGQYHGSKDTTPGSPMGTGGAGGSGMNGAPAGSASESALQPAKGNVEPARQTSLMHANRRQSATQARGSGQYHGSKDTTPGSPMGTGGAGGSGMSGSPAGSAAESALQPGKSAANEHHPKNTNSKRKNP